MDALAAARPEGCPACREREQEEPVVAERAQAKLSALLAESIVAILDGNLEHATGFARLAADRLDEDLQSRITALR